MTKRAKIKLITGIALRTILYLTLITGITIIGQSGIATTLTIFFLATIEYGLHAMRKFDQEVPLTHIPLPNNNTP